MGQFDSVYGCCICKKPVPPEELLSHACSIDNIVIAEIHVCGPCKSKFKTGEILELNLTVTIGE